MQVNPIAPVLTALALTVPPQLVSHRTLTGLAGALPRLVMVIVQTPLA